MSGAALRIGSGGEIESIVTLEANFPVVRANLPPMNSLCRYTPSVARVGRFSHFNGRPHGTLSFWFKDKASPPFVVSTLANRSSGRNVSNVDPAHNGGS